MRGRDITPSPPRAVTSVPRSTAGAASRTALPLRGHEALRLQRLYGNRRARGIIQAKLAVGPVDDPLEREADRVASEAMGPSVQRAPEAVGHVHDAAGGFAAPGVERAVARARGAGRPVPGGVRERMERVSGADFSGVRVHVDAESDRLNDVLGSRAFTVGADVFVRRGDYRPGSARGDELLGHELTHTIQQGAARPGTVARDRSDHGVAQATGPGPGMPLVQRRVTVGGADCPEPVDFVTTNSPDGHLLTDTGQRVLDFAKNGDVLLAAADATDLLRQAARIASMADLIDSVLTNGILGRRTLNQMNIGYQGSNDARTDQTPLAVNVLDARGAQPDFNALVQESLTVGKRGSFSVAMERPVEDDIVQNQIQEQLDLLAQDGRLQEPDNDYDYARIAANMALKDEQIDRVLNHNRPVFDERVQNTVMAVVPHPGNQIANRTAGNQTYESSVAADQLPPGPGPGGFTELLIPGWFQAYAPVLRSRPQGVTLIYVGNTNVTAPYRVAAEGSEWDVTTTAPDYAAALRPLLQQHGHVATHIVTAPTT